MRQRSFAAWVLLLGAVPGLRAQYVGKSAGTAVEKKTLRATAVYEYTGAMTKPNASRLVPVVVWDGERYQPGGLYLARPEPLAVTPGTQYVLEQSGVPDGLFNLLSAGQLNGAWVGLGRFAPDAPAPRPAKLAASKKVPVLTGGSGRGKATDSDADDEDSSRPVLHRKEGSDAGADSSGKPGASTGQTSGTGASSSSPQSAPQGGSGSEPTLHRRDSDNSPGSDTNSTSQSDDDRPTLHRAGSDSGASAPTPDPDRPTLHRAGSSSGTDASTSAPPPDPDRPTLHRHADDAASGGTAAPDPARPHLRYGQSTDADARVLPTELKDYATPGLGAAAAGSTGPGSLSATGAPVTIGQTVAISDTATDEPHPFRYAWPTPAAEADAKTAMHALALRALATAAQATFGPAARASAKENAALAQAATAAERTVAASAGSASAASGTSGTTHARRTPAASPAAPTADPLVDAEWSAFELSYGSGATYVYAAHTLAPGAARRYVTVIAQPDFYGKPHLVFSATTRGDQLTQAPLMHLIDAVDADGDHRAELLFELQGAGAAPGARQFALYSVLAGKAMEVYASNAGAGQ